MSGYKKYFEYGNRNMSFFIIDEELGEKYEQVWNVVKNKLKIKFHSKPVYEYKYLITKVNEFDFAIKASFLGNDIPKQNIRYTCIACITIDSVVKINEKYFLQVYLDECKYKIKKTQMSRFINTELKSDSDDDSDDDDLMIILTVILIVILRGILMILMMILINKSNGYKWLICFWFFIVLFCSWEEIFYKNTPGCCMNLIYILWIYIYFFIFSKKKISIEVSKVAACIYRI